MKFQKQKYLHNPSKGEIGDCWRTALACLLDLDKEDVPHWLEKHWDNEDMDDQVRKDTEDWLLERGYRLVSVTLGGFLGLAGILEYMRNLNPLIVYLLSGISNNQVSHVVICRGGELIWDTAKDDSGSNLAPYADINSLATYYEIQFLTPALV